MATRHSAMSPCLFIETGKPSAQKRLSSSSFGSNSSMPTRLRSQLSCSGLGASTAESSIRSRSCTGSHSPLLRSSHRRASGLNREPSPASPKWSRALLQRNMNCSFVPEQPLLLSTTLSATDLQTGDLLAVRRRRRPMMSGSGSRPHSRGSLVGGSSSRPCSRGSVVGTVPSTDDLSASASCPGSRQSVAGSLVLPGRPQSSSRLHSTSNSRHCGADVNPAQPSLVARDNVDMQIDPNASEHVEQAALVKRSPPNDIVWLARANHVPLDTCKQAAELYCTKCSGLDQAMDVDNFAHFLCLVANKESVDQLPLGLLEQSLQLAGAERTKSITFSQFLTWYSAVCFHVNLTVSETERDFRDFCQKHKMGLLEVDTYRKYFREFDYDGSEALAKDEFELLIKKCAKVPAGVEIPAARIKQLWNEADMDGNGTIDFEEFAIFYKKYFEGGSGFFDYYQKVRPVRLDAGKSS
eukprot:TRINITY_DN14345_c0_g1_i1.p1 TRINITY_DN14345_c0_g1~~TRINITY_DN14345_c0_g1_i1.p1  ORF type:complete len:478 (-),score=38.09 TRINITY_DN14345_c0_g1_i1:120-1520(-)